VGLRINTNIASLAAQRALGNSQRQLEKTAKQLASGDRFADISEGAGDFAIAEHLKAQIRGQRAAQMNAENATSFVQIAEGGLNEQNNILIRLRELAVQSASDTFDDTDRGFMNHEYTQLVSELDRIAQTTRFGSQSLLSGDSKQYEFQVGTHNTPNDIIAYNSDANTTASKLALSGTSIEDKDDARDLMETIDTALNKIAEQRSKFGAIQSRLDSVVSNSQVQVENLEAAHSRIADVDIAKAAADFVKYQVLTQYQAAVLAQANQHPSYALKVLGNA
jgi:flagellin